MTAVLAFKRRLKGLLCRSHELTHSDVDLTNLVVVTDVANLAITVKEDELEVLHLLEEIGHFEWGREIRIRVVLGPL